MLCPTFHTGRLEQLPQQSLAVASKSITFNKEGVRFVARITGTCSPADCDERCSPNTPGEGYPAGIEPKQFRESLGRRKRKTTWATRSPSSYLTSTDSRDLLTLAVSSLRCHRFGTPVAILTSAFSNQWQLARIAIPTVVPTCCTTLQ